MTGDSAAAAAAEILAAFQRVIDAGSDEDTARALATAFATAVRCHGRGRIDTETRYRLTGALSVVKDEAERILPPGYFDDRARHGCTALFGLLVAWAEPPGSDARVHAVSMGLEPMLRIVANDLDSLCWTMVLDGLLTPQPSPVRSPLAPEPVPVMTH